MEKTVEVDGRGGNLSHCRSQIFQVCGGPPNSACRACLPGIPLSKSELMSEQESERNWGPSGIRPPTVGGRTQPKKSSMELLFF